VTCDRVLLAAPRSFCAGVEMAIKALAWMVRIHQPPVYCYHEIVHNQVVVDRFRRAGVVFVDDVADVPEGAPLMLSAHGSAPDVVRAARARSDVVVDAVCPLVKKVHHEVRQRADRGHAVVYAGHATHDEAIGTLAVAPGATHLVERPADVAGLGTLDGPVAFLAQTTLALDDWEDVLGAARDRFGDVWTPGRSDLCFATTNRQAAVKAIAPRCDAVVVIGSASSSNTVALARVARAAAGSPGARVVRVNGPDELPDGLHGTVGVTAGASAPEAVVRSVLDRLAPREGIEVVDVTSEDEYFPPPRELRDLVRSLGGEAGRLLDGDRAVAASDVLRDLPDRTGGTVVPPTAEDPHVAEPPAPAAPAAPAVLGAHAVPVDRQMADVVERDVTDPWMRQAIGYHLGWLDQRFERPPSADGNGNGNGRGPGPAGGSGGKKLRASLAVLSYQAAAGAGPGAAVDRVVPLAAAVELFHNWSLVHDDIEDGDRTRRGRPALWTICGIPQAINVGDGIYALASCCLSRLANRGVPEPLVAQLLAELARTGVDLTVGQARDLAFEETLDIDVARYLEMIEGKTGALIRYAAYGGALIGSGGDGARARAFGEFGRRLGLAFQIRDDVLGIWGAGTETGKPTGADIRRRKKSLPIVVALDRTPVPDRDRLLDVYGGTDALTPTDEAFVRDALDRCGARVLAQDRARHHRDRAVAALAEAARSAPPAAEPHLAALRSLADFVTERTH
jgi:4-hydroxy-3-methylbut-2-enyl diphosphate reductase